MKITVSYHNLRGSEFIVPQIVEMEWFQPLTPVKEIPRVSTLLSTSESGMAIVYGLLTIS